MSFEGIIKEINSLIPFEIERETMNNGVSVYFLNAGDQPVLKIEALFDAGTAYAQNQTIPAAVNALMNDGTNNFKASKIAELIDGKGAFYFNDIQDDYSSNVLYVLNKFTDDLLPLFSDMIGNSVFDESEVDLYRERMKQNFLIDREKVDVLSRQAMLNTMFGKNGAYGDPVSVTSFEELNRAELIRFYDRFVRKKLKAVVVAGQINEDSRTRIMEILGGLPIENEEGSVELPIRKDSLEPGSLVELKDQTKQQVSMRFSTFTAPPGHPDYFGLRFLTTVLGGYFGSRLNKVLREEKGLTYGVHSSLVHLKKADYLSIHAQLNSENREQAYDSTLEVFNQLKTRKIGTEEFEMVKRYLKGQLLKSLDGPFSQSDYLHGTLMLNLDENRAQHYFEFLERVKPMEIKRIAQNYLNENSLYKIMAGV